MALSNHERVGKALDLLKEGLRPFVEREFRSIYKDKAQAEAARFVESERLAVNRPVVEWDVAPLLRLMWEAWNDVFRRVLGQAERTLVSELRDARNKWAHQEPFSTDDAYRALDSATRLLAAVSASQADDVEKMKMELLRLRFDEQVRSEKRRGASTAVEIQTVTGLKPWREVVHPHKDVASGRYQQAEFAADLWQVHQGEGSDEYRKPAEFFRRTFLTESLTQLLVGAVRRLAGDGGDPVVQLQTNFGGGKTHSMLALYHLFSGASPAELLGIDAVLAAAGVGRLPEVRRVVFVGNKISPGNPDRKPDGTEVRTMWGELAWQLGYAAGGAKEAMRAFERVRADDERATSPGDLMRALFNDYGPCLILIDEWVAYARQLHEKADLPGGSFETHFTFAQALTESAKNARNCLVVVSLPASHASGSPHVQADDVEVGGERGRAALDRLRNAVGRVEASWRPASAEEGFEIVRRRLFEPLTANHYVDRDRTAQAFFDLYRTQAAEFPPEARDGDYEKRLRAAYPIHPEIFDRLYTDWSALLKFQRTRGVLRLMAAVIHCLWEKEDRSPLILPANLPIEDQRVQFELTRYLSDNWVPVIAKDVDGPHALPRQIDADVGNLGKYSACRRVARTVYLGSAPTAGAANLGIEDRRIKLGCVMPGESPAVFGDALRRLSAAATYLYQDGPRYWYSTQPTVTKLAEDRAEQFKRNLDPVVKEIGDRLRADTRKPGDFLRIHALPQSSQDVPDDLDARLVVLGVDHPHGKEPGGSAAEAEARRILETRGNAPRLRRNTLVFLAIDKTRLQDLDEAVRRYLAWEEIVAGRETLGLTPHQAKQAEMQKASADSAVTARLPEAYQWLLVPVQATPQDPLSWQAIRLTGAEPLAVRASRKLRSEELFVAGLAGTRLRMEIDRAKLLRGEPHVAVKQLLEDFARFTYLPRLREPAVLLRAVADGVGLTTWRSESFAYADGFDAATGRYRGLRGGQILFGAESVEAGLLVDAAAACRQLDGDARAAEAATSAAPSSRMAAVGSSPATKAASAETTLAPTPVRPARRPTRFHATVRLDPNRVGRDAGKVAEAVIQHLAGIVGASVEVTMEISASVPVGVPENTVRIVSENANTLKMKAEFEEA